MNLNQTYRQLLGVICTSLSALTLLSSCDSMIYADGEECDPTYRLRFRYDMNLKWADAFANEVTSVKLCAYDTRGNLVWEHNEKGLELAREGYTVQLPLPPGDYRFTAWCGTDNDAGSEGRNESFTVAPTVAGESVHEDLFCTLNSKTDGEHPNYSDEHLYSLFHGTMQVTLPDTDNGEEYIYTMPLVKDTNHVRVILQHLSDEDVDVDDFTFHIEDDNGNMAHDNTLLPSETVRYRTWKTQNGTAGVGKDDAPQTRGLVYVNGAIADMTVGRLTTEHKDRMMLTINTKTGEKVAQVPVIHYALLAKDYYEEAYRKQMTDQEFLDREDEYTLTFFLDENNRWVNSSIMIHSWKIVLQNEEI